MIHTYTHMHSCPHTYIIHTLWGHTHTHMTENTQLHCEHIYTLSLTHTQTHPQFIHYCCYQTKSCQCFIQSKFFSTNTLKSVAAPSVSSANKTLPLSPPLAPLPSSEQLSADLVKADCVDSATDVDAAWGDAVDALGHQSALSKDDSHGQSSRQCRRHSDCHQVEGTNNDVSYRVTKLNLSIDITHA